MPTRAAPALLFLLSFAGSASHPRAHARELASPQPTTAKLEVERSAASEQLVAVEHIVEHIAEHTTDCTADCNDNGVEDAVDIAVGYSSDLDGNGVPDECENGR
jgi:hypothetical protein